MNEISDASLDERITLSSLKLNGPKQTLVSKLLTLKVDLKA